MEVKSGNRGVVIEDMDQYMEVKSWDRGCSH